MFDLTAIDILSITKLYRFNVQLRVFAAKAREACGETRLNRSVQKFERIGGSLVAQITSLTKGCLCLSEDRAQEERWSGPKGEGILEESKV